MTWDSPAVERPGKEKQMNIALLADDGKKELMVQFCIAYCGILSDHTLCATNTTGKLVSEATGLPITLYLHDKQGAQQIGARIAYNEIDLVLYFCDPAHPDGFESVNKLARLCDQYLRYPWRRTSPPPRCSYRASAAGDLDWRDIVNPKKK